MSEAPPTRITPAIIMNDTTAALMPTWEGCFRLKYVFSMCLMVLYMYRVIRSPTVLSTTRFNGIPRRAQNMQKSRPPNVTGTICPKPRWRRNNIRNGSSMENSFRVQKAYNLVPKVLEPFGPFEIHSDDVTLQRFLQGGGCLWLVTRSRVKLAREIYNQHTAYPLHGCLQN